MFCSRSRKNLEATTRVDLLPPPGDFYMTMTPHSVNNLLTPTCTRPCLRQFLSRQLSLSLSLSSSICAVPLSAIIYENSGAALLSAHRRGLSVLSGESQMRAPPTIIRGSFHSAFVLRVLASPPLCLPATAAPRSLSLVLPVWCREWDGLLRVMLAHARIAINSMLVAKTKYMHAPSQPFA